MNWEKSRALTPLKRDFLIAFFAREQRFFLRAPNRMRCVHEG
jgi:hypothetical protein